MPPFNENPGHVPVVETPTEQMELEGFESELATWEEIKGRPKNPRGFANYTWKEEVEATIAQFHKDLEKKMFISRAELTNLVGRVRGLYKLPKDEDKRFVVQMLNTYGSFELSSRQKMEKMIEIINSVVSGGDLK